MPKLTRKKAIDWTLELWIFLATDGTRRKDDWPKWQEIKDKGYRVGNQLCLLCDYDTELGTRLGCGNCPYFRKFRKMCGDGPYGRWFLARKPSTRKKYAEEVVAELKQL